MTEQLKYLSGFASHFQSEAIEGALPYGQNSPQRAPLGLYAEQLSGSAFTAPRHRNLRSWLYRIRPSVLHDDFQFVPHDLLCETTEPPPPTQMRWDPQPYPSTPTDFVDSLVTIANNGSAESQTGAAIHLYCATQSMQGRYFYDADGELLIVLQEGKLRFNTELGRLDCEPGEIIVIPRGIKFSVTLLEEKARGYICENFAAPFHLPDLGPIGANGLANPRDFQYPTAHYEQQDGDFLLLCKFQSRLWSAKLDHSPLDVVAWHGNYAPYKYNLKLFNTINTVSFDHPDPSIFTVLTSQTNSPGVANVDFVIFPDRWMVAENTFRPPYYHRNMMNEYMGLIYGEYDAKEEGFAPGGGSLHNCMSAHGPDKDAFEKASNAELKPERYHGTLAFMFESCLVWKPSNFALNGPTRQKAYLDCWQGLAVNFKEK